MVISIGVVISFGFLFATLLFGLVAMMYYLLWSKKHSSSMKVSNLQEQGDVINVHGQDLEGGGDAKKNTEDLKNCCREGGVDTELMRLHNLHGPPRFLFTIKEETKEDLEDKCLNDFLASSDLTSVGSPNSRVESLDRSCDVRHFNHLFESSIDEEISTLRSSPPSKFKFLRDAEERWLRKMMERDEKECEGHVAP